MTTVNTTPAAKPALLAALLPTLLVGLVALVIATTGAGHAQESQPAKPEKKPEAEKQPNPALTNPALANEKAPAKFKVKFVTTKGTFVVEVTRAWAPIGADRVYNLVKIGYFKDIGFFRVMDNFMAQFGIHGDPSISRYWKGASIKDDPVVESNKRGFVTFAKMRAANTRTTQLFINFKDNSYLDKQGFAPFGKVIQGMDVVDKIYKVEQKPNQGRILAEGNRYLAKFPELDYIRSATILE